MAPGKLQVRSRRVVTVTAEGPEAAEHKGRVHLLSALDTRTVPSHVPLLYFYPPPSDPQAGCARDQSEAAPSSDVEAPRWRTESAARCAAPLPGGERQGGAAPPLAGSSLEDVVGVLRPSFARALSLYYPLAGRLVWAGMDGVAFRLGIHCSNAGVPFASVEVAQSMRDSLGDDWRRDLGSMPQGLTSNPSPGIMPNTWNPLMSVQVTRFSCGGFVVAVTFHHHATDGSGFFSFMAAWSALATQEHHRRRAAHLPLSSPRPAAPAPHSLGGPSQEQGQVPPLAEGQQPAWEAAGAPVEETGKGEGEGIGVQGSSTGAPAAGLPPLAPSSHDLVHFFPSHHRQDLLSRASSKLVHTCTIEELRGSGSWLRMAWAQVLATVAFLVCLLRVLTSVVRLVPQYFGHPPVSSRVYRVTAQQVKALKGLVMSPPSPPLQLPHAQESEEPPAKPSHVALEMNPLGESTTGVPHAHQEASADLTAGGSCGNGAPVGLSSSPPLPTLPHSVSAPMPGSQHPSPGTPTFGPPHPESPASHASHDSPGSRPSSSQSDRSSSSSGSFSSSSGSSASSFFGRARHMRLGSRSSSGSSVSSLSAFLGGSPSPPRSSPLCKIESQAAAEAEAETQTETGAEPPEAGEGTEMARGAAADTEMGSGAETATRLGPQQGVTESPSAAIDMAALMGAEEEPGGSQGVRAGRTGDHQVGRGGGHGRQSKERLSLRLPLRAKQLDPLEAMGEEEIANLLLFGTQQPTHINTFTTAPTGEGSNGAEEGEVGRWRERLCPKAAQRSINAQRHSLAFSCRGREGRDARGVPSACDWASSDDVLCALMWKAITLVRGQTGDSRVAFRRAVEVRSRVDPPLAPGFFGNATVGVPEENLWATAGDLLRMPTSQLACLLRGEIQRVDEAYFAASCRGRLLNSLEGLVDGAIGSSIIASSWVKFDIYSFDFGLGAPAFVTAAYGNKPSLITGAVVFQRCGPRAEGGGDIDMTIMLPRPQLHSLEAVLALLQREADRHAAAV